MKQIIELVIKSNANVRNRLTGRVRAAQYRVIINKPIDLSKFDHRFHDIQENRFQGMYDSVELFVYDFETLVNKNLKSKGLQNPVSYVALELQKAFEP